MSGECNLCGEMGHTEGSCPDVEYENLAVAILDLVSEDDPLAADRRRGMGMVYGANFHATKLVKEWAENRLRKPPEEVLLSEEFLTKFAKAFHGMALPGNTALTCGAPNPTRVEPSLEDLWNEVAHIDRRYENDEASRLMFAAVNKAYERELARALEENESSDISPHPGTGPEGSYTWIV